jgi:hypothetical protein
MKNATFPNPNGFYSRRNSAEECANNKPSTKHFTSPTNAPRAKALLEGTITGQPTSRQKAEDDTHVKSSTLPFIQDRPPPPEEEIYLLNLSAPGTRRTITE